jgi:twinkle protein
LAGYSKIKGNRKKKITNRKYYDMIIWEKIDLKGKSSGQIKTTCPACIDRRTNKKDRSLSVNITSGLANCHYCNEFSIRDIEEKQENEYKLPSQNWKNYTKLSKNLVKWFEDVRGISQSTLINCGITEEKYYQPAHAKEVNNVVFNYFEGEKLVNKKYRSGDKKFTQSAGTKNIFYGINDILGQDEVYIVEGEMDKLAMYEIGIKNCISVPNGANDNDDVWQNSKKYLEGIEKFIIATDCDEKGNELAEKIAQRLGRWKCARVTFQNKDANGELLEGREKLLEAIKTAKKYPVSGTYSSEDLLDGIFQLYDNGLPEKIYPKCKSFGNLKNIFSVMRGHLVTVTGIPSHGKSEFMEWYTMNLVKDYNMKMAFFSPEHHPLELHKTKFIQKFIGKSFFFEPRITKDEILEYNEWAKEKIYLTTTEKGEFPTWDWLFDKMKEQMYGYGIDIFCIDAFNKLDFTSGDNHLKQINQVLAKLTMFAQMHNVIIFLVAHPTKMKKENGIYECPTLYDVSGSADFRNQTHDGFAIYRHFSQEEFQEEFTEFINLKTKYSFQGEITGREGFKFHLPSGRYYAKSTEPYTDKFFKLEESKPQYLGTPEEAFYEVENPNDEIPF